MKVVLLENLDKQGKKGEVIEVADGFAMNHLLPKKLAKVATPEALAEIEKMKKQEEAKRAEKIREANKLKEKLDGYKLIIKSKANEEGHLFGAVDEKAVANNLQEKKFEVEAEMVKLDEHIKEIGEYDIEVEFFEGVSVQVKLNVQAEK